MAYTSFNDIPRASIKRQCTRPVIVSTFEDESEQRRLVTDKKMLSWEIKTQPMSIEAYQDFITFYESTMKGALNSGNFTCPIDGQTYVVRFSDSAIPAAELQGVINSFTVNLVVANQDEV